MEYILETDQHILTLMLLFDIQNWSFEKPTPGASSLAYKLLIEQEENDAFWKTVFFYVGISAGGVLILLFLVPLWRKIKNKNKVYS